MYFRGAHAVLTRTGLDQAEHELIGYLDRVPPRALEKLVAFGMTGAFD